MTIRLDSVPGASKRNMDENAANGQASVPITKIKFRNLRTKEATKITSRPNV